MVDSKGLQGDYVEYEWILGIIVGSMMGDSGGLQGGPCWIIGDPE